MEFPLLELPEELIVHTFSLPENESTELLHLALTCRCLSRIVVPLLYVHPRLDHGNTHIFARVVEDTCQASAVRSLTYRLETTPFNETMPTLAKFTHLTTLRVTYTSRWTWKKSTYMTEIEGRLVPMREYDSEHDVRSDFFGLNTICIPGAPQTLTSLRSLSLCHSDAGNGSSMMLGRWIFLLSASLRSVSLNKATFSFMNMVLFYTYPYSTPLEYLYLDNCTMDYFSMYFILRLPRALKSLVISQSEGGSARGGHFLRQLPNPRGPKQEWVDILAVQAHSLEEINAEGLVWREEGPNKMEEEDLEFFREEFGSFGRLRRLKVNSKVLIPSPGETQQQGTKRTTHSIAAEGTTNANKNKNRPEETSSRRVKGPEHKRKRSADRYDFVETEFKRQKAKPLD